MRKLVVILGAVMLSLSSFASTGPTLSKEISNKAVFDLSSIELDAQNRDFVAVKFRIIDGEIEILRMNGSQRILIERVYEKLESMKIDANHQEGQQYVVKFSFEKE